jgi:hypothetical protein
MTAKPSFRTATQEENRGASLENLHRELKAHQDAYSHLDVQWVLLKH